jgi:hypothetical protein
MVAPRRPIEAKERVVVLLRAVELGDVDAYVRMRCHPIMMAELGGPLPRAGMEAKVERDVNDAAAGTAWIKMIVPDPAHPEVVAGTVVLTWSGRDGGLRSPNTRSAATPSATQWELLEPNERRLLDRVEWYCRLQPWTRPIRWR